MHLLHKCHHGRIHGIINKANTRIGTDKIPREMPRLQNTRRTCHDTHQHVRNVYARHSGIIQLYIGRVRFSYTQMQSYIRHQASCNIASQMQSYIRHSVICNIASQMQSYIRHSVSCNIASQMQSYIRHFVNFNIGSQMQSYFRHNVSYNIESGRVITHKISQSRFLLKYYSKNSLALLISRYYNTVP